MPILPLPLLQLVGLLSLEDCLGRRQIQGLIRAMPVLLNHAPETLRWNFEVCHTTERVVLHGVRRCALSCLPAAICNGLTTCVHDIHPDTNSPQMHHTSGASCLCQLS